MARFWINNTQTLEGDGTNIISSNTFKSAGGFVFASADVYMDDDGDDLRIGVKTNADIFFMNGAVEVAKINETGVTDLIP